MKMEFKKDLIIVVIGYFLSIFFSMIGLIYGLILYLLKKDNNEMYYEHSRNIMAVAIIFIILRLFISLGHMIF